MTTRERRPLALAAGVLLLLAGCGGGGSGGDPAPATHAISGAISGDVLDGVTVALGGAASRTTVTSGGGQFTFTGLENGEYNVAPALAGYAFAPLSRPVTLAGADAGGLTFSATSTAARHAISGAVAGPLRRGVLVRLTGDASLTTTSDGDGAYAFPGLRPGSYTVAPEAQGGTFDPPSRAVTLGAADAAAVDFGSAVAGLTLFDVGGRPEQIVAGLDGNLWYADSTGNQIVRLTPGGVVTRFDVPTAASGVWGLAAVEGGVAFTEAAANKVGVMTFDGTFLGEWPVPTANARPLGITVAADGALYFVESHQPGPSQMDRVGRVTAWATPADPAFGVTDIALGVGGRTFTAIVSAAPADTLRLFVSEALSGQLASVRTSLHPSGFSAGFTFDLPVQQSSTNGLAATADAIWFTEFTGGAVGKLALVGGAIQEWAVPTVNAGPLGITVGPDGVLWFTEFNKAKVGWIDPDVGVVNERAVPGGGSPAWIAAGADGNLWVTMQTPGFVARVVP